MKKMLFASILILTTSVMLNGCAAVAVSAGSALVGTSLMNSDVKNAQTYHPTLTKNNQKKAAKVIVYRVDKGGMTAVLNVKVDDQNYGPLPTNAYTLVTQENLKNKQMKFYITSNTRMKHAELTLENLEQGKTYYIDVDTISLVGIGTISAKIVEEDDVPKRFRKDVILAQ